MPLAPRLRIGPGGQLDQSPRTHVEGRPRLGLTLIRKSDGAPRKRKPKIALVLAGGAVSGGAFKVGGLKALDDFLVDRKIIDLDLYVGLSAGSLLAVSLAGGHHARRDGEGARGHERQARAAHAAPLLQPERARVRRAPGEVPLRPLHLRARRAVELPAGAAAARGASARARARSSSKPNYTARRRAGDGADRARLAVARDAGAHQPHPDRLLRQRGPRALAPPEPRAHPHAERLPRVRAQARAGSSTSRPATSTRPSA